MFSKLSPNQESLKPCLEECRHRKGHVLWCENHPDYPHDGPDPFYEKLNTRHQHEGEKD